MSANPTMVPLEKNHELHGVLFGVATAGVLKVCCRIPVAESITIGGMAGVVATAAMKTYGHPNILSLKSILPT